MNIIEVQQVKKQTKNVQEPTVSKEFEKIKKNLKKQEIQQVSQEKKALATPAVRHAAKQMGIDINKVKGSGPDGRILIQDLQKPPQQEIIQQMKKALATPAVRKIAKEFNISLDLIEGSGEGGRVLKSDIDDFLATQEKKPIQVAVKEQKVEPTVTVKTEKKVPPVEVVRQPVTPKKQEEPIQAPQIIQIKKTSEITGKIMKTNAIQRGMIKQMQKSLDVPSFTLMDDYSMDNLIKLRNSLKNLMPSGVKLTYMPIIMKILSLTIQDFPLVNSFIEDQGFAVNQSHNISIAIDSPFGLLVPNVKNVESKSIVEIGQRLMEIQNLANAGRLSENELQGGTICISNIGAIGGTYMKPVVVTPQVLIGALGKTKTELFLKDGQVAQKNIMNVSWSADQRVLSTQYLQQFSNRMKEIIANPEMLMLRLK